MKIIALAGLFAYSNALATTFRNCWDTEGVTHESSCRSLWYKMCDNFMFAPGTTCNFITESDASIQWFSDSLEVVMWNYVMRFDENDSSSPETSDQWTLRQAPERTCQQASLGSEIYKSETRLQARNGNCGYKFQVINNSERGSYDLKFLRNAAEMLAVGFATTASIKALLL